MLVSLLVSDAVSRARLLTHFSLHYGQKALRPPCLWPDLPTSLFLDTCNACLLACLRCSLPRTTVDPLFASLWAKSTAPPLSLAGPSHFSLTRYLQCLSPCLSPMQSPAHDC